MWSDPDEIENWAVSPRGAGWLFGGSVVKEVKTWWYSPDCLTEYQFNHVNNLQLVARAHQLVQEGYKYMFDEQLVTVWSAPNYCYRCGNLASIMTVHEDGTRDFTVYDAAPENARDKAQGKRLVGQNIRIIGKPLISDRPTCNISSDSSRPRVYPSSPFSGPPSQQLLETHLTDP
jgi:serine/threonine-protein phosphatase 6 catalytic subunit